MIDIQIKMQDFDAYQALQLWQKKLQQDNNAQEVGVQEIGAICHFIGLMRACNQRDELLQSMNLEHYAGMCEKILHNIADDVMRQFQIEHLLLWHRVGEILPQQPILLIAAASKHRQAAFDSCHYFADRLKIEAPFWKEEITKTGQAEWVAQKQQDLSQQAKWVK
ncbi:MAG: molybdenum cofactor biosynthesis protein MoaE [Alphaproteobacteria bacterium]|nr:molybdenum cofactor biosynthesis protein MoaE [Alphaproteobacteria bacterium]